MPWLVPVAAAVGIGTSLYSAYKSGKAADEQTQIAKEAMNKKPADLLEPTQRAMYPALYQRIAEALNAPPPAYRGQLSVGYKNRPAYNMNPAAPTPIQFPDVNSLKQPSALTPENLAELFKRLGFSNVKIGGNAGAPAQTTNQFGEKVDKCWRRNL